MAMAKESKTKYGTPVMTLLKLTFMDNFEPYAARTMYGMPNAQQFEILVNRPGFQTIS